MSEKIVESKIIEPIIFKLCLTNAKYTSFIADNVDFSWFDDAELSKLMNATCKYYQKYSKLPKREIFDVIISKLIDEENYSKVLNRVNTILANTNDYNDEYIEETFLKYIVHIGYYSILAECVIYLDNHDHNKLEDAQERIKDILTLSFDNNLGLDYFENLEEFIDELQRPESFISTGWDNVDEVLNGGLPKDGKCLLVWMGESHIGKSLFLSNLAANLSKDNKFGVIITLEMSEHVYAKRVTAHLTNININTLNCETENIRKRVTIIKNSNEESKLAIKEFPPDTINCNNIKTYVDKLIQQFRKKPDYIIVDYINLLIPTGKVESGTYVNVAKITKQLRALSYIFGVPVISVTQVNRDGYNRNDAGMENVSDSMGIAHTADFIAHIYQNDGDKDLGIIRNRIVKNRIGGRVGKNLDFKISNASLTISSMDNDSEIFDSDDNDAQNKLIRELAELDELDKL